MIKKIFLLFSKFSPIAVVSLALLCACSGKQSTNEIKDTSNSENTNVITHTNNSKNTDSESSIFSTDSIVWNDTIITNAGNSASCNINVLWPEKGDPQAVNSIRKWIASQLVTTQGAGQGNSITSVITDENIADGKKLITAVGKALISDAVISLSEFESDFIDYKTGYTYDWKINNILETDNVITYSATCYMYMGGAHGGSTFNAQTFRTSDGKMFGRDMFKPESLTQVKQYIKEGLKKQYFKVESDEMLMNSLLLESDTIPLPSSAPYFTINGIAFGYQQYEIAPYSAGMPACVIPYDQIKPLLTDDAAALIPIG